MNITKWKSFCSKLKLLLVFAIALVLSACESNSVKGAKINPQEATSQQEVLDIIEIVNSRITSTLGKKLNKIPSIEFVNIEQLKSHITSHRRVETEQELSSLAHYSHAVSAIYCEINKEIYIVPENFEIYEQRRDTSNNESYYSLLVVITHELIHALQDQENLLGWNGRTEKEVKDFSALVEGHAEMQSALVLKRMGVISDIYKYGTEVESKTSSEDKQQADYEEEFSKKYIVGKKFFNRIHKKYGNDETWNVLANPANGIAKLLNNKE